MGVELETTDTERPTAAIRKLQLTSAVGSSCRALSHDLQHKSWALGAIQLTGEALRFCAVRTVPCLQLSAVAYRLDVSLTPFDSFATWALATSDSTRA